MKKHLIWNGLLSILYLISCTEDGNYEYSKIQDKEVPNFDFEFSNYCNLDFNSNFELNAVECSIYGDYFNALDQATKNESVSGDPLQNIVFESGMESEMKNSLNEIIQSNETDDNDKIHAEKLLKILKSPEPKELISQSKKISALEYIEDEVKNYHFTLINEAHWNSQHRSFTKSLLKPLWGQGYRYLALETLSYDDSTLHERGYPIRSTGFYTKDTDFGNLVREAISLGYKLIAYETRNGKSGTLRDKDQAENIYQKTFSHDKTGKVLIHAGYSHISETGDSNYEPMGYQLKNLVNQDLLTIDQVAMIGYKDISKQHQYYKEAVAHFDYKEPSVFINKEGEMIVDPINSFGIDIQVHHPETKINQGRPDWKYQKGIRSIPLSIELMKYNGHLIQVVKNGEGMDAVPVDQFIISEEKHLLLYTGKYEVRIINCSGTMVATSELTVL
jgi:hypothetical protein